MEKENQRSLTVTGSNSVGIYDPETLSTSLAAVKTTSDALALATSGAVPSLAKIRAVDGTKKAEAIVGAYLVELTDILNLKRSLEEEQLPVIAAEIVSRYYMLTIADIHVVFRRAKNGGFGVMYETLDMPKIMNWFDTYFDERCQLGMEDSLAHQFKNDSDPRSSFLAKREFDTMEAKIKLKGGKR